MSGHINLIIYIWLTSFRLAGLRHCRAEEFWYFQSMTGDFASYFERRSDVCGGEMVLKGTRVTVRTVLGSLAEGSSVAEILADFPTLSEAAVRAVIAFAALSAEEDLPLPGTPTLA